MIIVDKDRIVPTDWTEELLHELFEHARDLGHNGNPAGYFLAVDVFPFVGFTENGENRLKSYKDWDYNGIRQWIAENQEEVKLVWQFKIAPPY